MEQEERSLDATETSSNTVDNDSPSSDLGPLVDSTEGYEASEKKFDIVAIHGLGDLDKPWSSSKTNTWIQDLAAHMNWEVRIIRYAYHATKLAEATHPEEAIASEASALLQKLSELRRGQQHPLPLAFFAHDIGGIIAKKALILASRYDSEHADISYSTTLLMFFGCPHRTLDTHQNIEILASRLEMLTPADSIVAKAIMRCLARSIIDVNNSFLNTRVLTRANVINITSSKTDATERVFDKYTAALGVPMEKVLLIDKSHKELIDEPEAYAPYGGFQTKRISSFPCQNDKLSHVMRAIMHQAPPIHPFKFNTTRGFVWISEHDTMVKWLKSWGLGLLHIHGTSAISNVAQHVYEGIIDRGKSTTFRAILYFKFDKHDIQRNSIGAMANSFLLQILSQIRESPNSKMPDIEPPDFSDCWTDKDAFFFLEKLMRDITTNGEIHWIIDGLDQCDDSSALFLSMVSDMAKNSEQHFKILVTTVDDSQIRKALSEFPSIDLREHPLTADVMESIVLESMTELCQVRPQYRHVEQEIRQLLDSCGDDDLLRRLLFEWLLIVPCASTKSALERELASLTPLSPAKVFERCLHMAPESSRPWARKVLMWMSLSFRPLTPEELGSALSLDTSTDSVSEPETYGDLMWDIEKYLGPMIIQENGHVQLRHPAARNFLTTISDASDRERPWYALNSLEEGHREITDTCVGYLTLPSTQDKIIAACRTCPVDQRIFESPSDITSYAVEFWSLHYQLGHSSVSPKPESSSIASFFNDDTALKRWDAARWFLSNPHIRSDRLFLSHMPVIASIGDGNSVETWIQSQESDERDISQALIEASRYGHSDVVKLLLQKSSANADICLEAVMIAARSAELETLGILLAYVIETLQITQWPGMLTSRLAYLGSAEHLKTILGAGADVNSTDPDCSPPLHCAIVRDETAAFNTLIEHGADPTVLNSNWVDTPPIVVAGKFGQAKIIDRLAKTALVDAQDKKGRNALWYAGGRGHHAVLQALIKAGANTDVLTANVRELRPALIPIVGAPYPKCLESVLDAGLDINSKLREVHSFHALGIAARSGHVEICRMLLDHGTCKEFDDDSALIHAARANNIETVNMLLKEGHKVDVQLDDSEYHGTPLVAAARAGYTDIVTALLEKGADVNYAAPKDITPLMSAVLGNQAAIAKTFIDAGADMNAVSGAENNKWNATHFAYDLPDCMKVLVEAGADINALGPDGTPFYLAAYFNQTKVVELLLEHKPDLETKCPEGDFTDAGYTPLLCAASCGYNKLLRLLLEAGADIEAKTPKGGTPLILAVATNQEESVKILLEYNLDIDARDIWEGSAIFCLPTPANLSVVRRLINRGASLTIRNKERYTPLGKAVVNGDLPLVRLLSSQKIDLNAEAAENGTALHIATEKCNVDIVKLLVEKGASPDVANSWMYGSPLQRLFEKYYTSAENKDIIARHLINDAGADVNVHGGNMGSVLNAAILSGSLDMIKLIIEKGADIGWQDLQGRRPIHYAALKTVQHFNLLLEASGDDEERLGITTKTKSGLTVLHFAVATGRSDLVELVLSHTSGTISINEPDDDGWTPLLWACRVCESWGTPKEVSLEIVKLLLDRGADPSIRGRTSDDREWSPLKMARFHSASQEVIDLLTASPSKKKEDDWKSKFHVSKKAARTTWYCDLCLFHVYGILYYCDGCELSYGLCFKCYRYREEFHPYHDKWAERGPEFVEDDEEEEEEKEEEEDDPKSSPGIEQVQDDDSEGDWSNDEAEGGG
ncbi:ankyrin protein 1 [Fusarium denticulatum]|uniref:Ankyrin protein 1 n=1 Tax=Fusarium denticulatum TaxID=48507 RepID=A0A8H5XD05_9HYPO|nr:ankyrin protein 1 [Fusarium denticulatum]